MKKILCLLWLLLLASCEKLDEIKSFIPFYKEKPLLISTGLKEVVFIDPHLPDYVHAEGFWILTSDHNKVLDTNYEPYCIKILCRKSGGYCSVKKTMIALLKLSNMYYLTSNQEEFEIEKWNKGKIIAIQKFGDPCFIHILKINLYTQEVFMKSVLKDSTNLGTHCSSFKELQMPITNKLVNESEYPWEYSISLTRKIKKTDSNEK